MNTFIEKYLKFYNASLTGSKSEGKVIISKLNGKKTNLKVTISLNTFYQVMVTKYRDDINISILFSDDKELISITSDTYKLLEDLMFQYGGWIDDSYIFGHKYTLQIFEYTVHDDLKLNASI